MEKTIKTMTNKVTEVTEAFNNVRDYLDVIEETTAQHGQALTELEQELQTQQEAFSMAQDLGEAKLLQQQIKDTEANQELIQQVNKAKVNAMYAELEDKAEAFFKVHKEAVQSFRELDNAIVVNTSLGELENNIELMRGFERSLNGAFAGVRNILLDTKIVSQAEQNRQFKGYHLGQRGLTTGLLSFQIKVSSYVRDLKGAGLL